PYALIGRNTNLTSNAINNNQTTNPDGTKSLNANVTQDYFLTGGLGARLEYQVDHYWLFYYDQNLIYNSDRSQPTSDYSSANNIQLTSLLGVKANVWDELQIGVSGFYTYSKLTASKTFNQQYELYPQNQVGAMVSLGLTY
ncbi:MAG: hypothetical protein RLZZ293_539, partial [Pseudomonadota bacterium]